MIANLRWRSAGFRTWVDWENIYGNGAGDSFAECACGLPILAGSEDDELTRYASYLTLPHVLDERNRLAVELSYGQQDDAAFANKDDANWYGANPQLVPLPWRESDVEQPRRVVQQRCASACADGQNRSADRYP
ncbi:hypothetical protein MMZ75_33920 (plasmid) [Pseudomonas aeruginosa]|nr:hypothetical protein [Pseudomonas aeruginosa]UTN35935.1 hypothetical protein MMZ75_33920 [Pseudomonas aeruginosa]